MKLTIKGYVYVEETMQYRDDDGKAIYPPRKAFRAGFYSSGDLDLAVFGACMGPSEFVVEVPDADTVRGMMMRAQLDSLTKAREEAAREFAATVRKIDERIAKLTAIGMEA